MGVGGSAERRRRSRREVCWAVVRVDGDYGDRKHCSAFGVTVWVGFAPRYSEGVVDNLVQTGSICCFGLYHLDEF